MVITTLNEIHLLTLCGTDPCHYMIFSSIPDFTIFQRRASSQTDRRPSQLILKSYHGLILHEPGKTELAAGSFGKDETVLQLFNHVDNRGCYPDPSEKLTVLTYCHR